MKLFDVNRNIVEVGSGSDLSLETDAAGHTVVAHRTTGHDPNRRLELAHFEPGDEEKARLLMKRIAVRCR